MIEPLPIDGVYRIRLDPACDMRGSFTRIFSASGFQSYGLESHFIEHSESFNAQKGTLRGLHFQQPPHEEIKLIRCIYGRVYDVVVDIRPSSPTYLQHVAVELNSDLPELLYVSHGLAHGFLTLADNSRLHYMINTPYAPKAQAGIRWDDPALGISWPDTITTISERDRQFPDWQISKT